MSYPLSAPSPENGHRANWLGRYLTVQSVMDKKLNEILEQAAEDAEKALINTKADTYSGTVQRIQYNFALQSIRRTLHGLFKDTGNIIRNDRKDAVVAAVDAATKSESTFLNRIFTTNKERQDYISSLRATAQRNVESTIARVYFSEKPLSQRVYKTEALANGWIRRTINSGIARGDSARELAKSVSRNIRPDVPGGVAYAAKRLGRTELNNAFHAQSILDQQDKPWIDHAEWFLSKVHEPENCLCEIYAKQRRFPANLIPEKPHPNCRCYVVPVLIDYQSFENNLLIGIYDQYLEHAIAS